MMYQLRDKGIVSLDDYVDQYMPNFTVKSTFPSNRRITLRQLASHTSGLQREMPCYNANPYSCTEEEILANLAESYLLYRPNSMPHYSNLGVSILGRTLEKAVGVQYEDYVIGNICKPLSMNATFSLSQQQRALLAIGSTQLANGTVVPAPIVDDGWPAPSGGLLATGWCAFG